MYLNNDLKRIIEEDKLHLKSQFVSLNSEHINDFPKLDQSIIKTNITLGTYQLKQALSYLDEHINEKKIEIRVNKQNLNYKSSKILFAIIKSRHANATKYKVYCKYKPNSNDVDAIESWYCTCKTGMRTVGVCSHVACIIYFFAHGKYLDYIPSVGGSLLSIFPTNVFQESQTQSIVKNQKSSKTKSKTNIETTDSECDENFGSDSYDSFDEINQSMKSLVSDFTDDETEPKMKRKKSIDQLTEKKNSQNSIFLDSFSQKIPKWGGLLVDENNNSLRYELTNTCTIDYFLLAFWTCAHINKNIMQYIGGLSFEFGNDILQIIDCIEHINWNRAKSIWLSKILYWEYDLTCKCEDCIVLTDNKIISNNTISTYGSEYEFFLNPIIQLQKYRLVLSCSSICPKNKLTKDSVSFNFKKKNDEVSLSFTEKNNCDHCKGKINIESVFFKSPPWIFIQIIDKVPIFLDDLPKVLIINEIKYQFLCATIHTNSPNHFRSIFFLDNNYFLIDDLKTNKIDTKIPHIKVITCFYFKSD